MYVILGINAKGWKKVLTISVGDNEIVHQVRNTLKYVPNKDRKAFVMVLKTIN